MRERKNGVYKEKARKWGTEAKDTETVQSDSGICCLVVARCRFPKYHKETMAFLQKQISLGNLSLWPK